MGLDMRGRPAGVVERKRQRFQRERLNAWKSLHGRTMFQVKQGMKLLTVANAMMPGVFMLSAWDIVGALPMTDEEVWSDPNNANNA